MFEWNEKYIVILRHILISENMEFSSIAFCAEDKRAINFHAFPLLSSRTFINQSSGIGIHKSEEIPYVELTGHRMGGPHVHSSFEMAELNLTKRFSLTGKIHSFTNSTKNLMTGHSFLPRKDMYSSKFPTVALSQLVGGFVGSKSQLGSSGRESCQIWDIIFDKFVEFCGAPQSACCSLFSKKDPRSCCKLEKNLSEEILQSFCKENVSNVTADLLQEKVSDSVPHPNTVSCVSVSLSVKPAVSVMSPCLQNGNKLCHASGVSRQSYAEVAKTVALAQQKNKHLYTRASAMKKRRNTLNCGDMLRSNSRHFGCSVDNWRYCRDSSIKDYRSERKLAFSCKKKSQYSKHNKVANMEKMGKTEKNNRDVNISESNFERVNRNVQKMKQDSPKTVPSEATMWHCHKKIYMDRSQVANDSTANTNSNCMKSRGGKFAESCVAVKCNSVTTAEMDQGIVFSHEVECGSMSVLIHAGGNINTSPSNPEGRQSSKERSVRSRCMSDCSTDSDDSFVIFESGVDCDPVIKLLISDSDLSEDGANNQFSDDDDDDDGGDDAVGEESDDTEVRNKAFEM